jgi:hypothetical protein
MSIQTKLIEFPHYKISGNQVKPLATLENLTALLNHVDFRIVYLAESNETHFFLADKIIATFNKRPNYWLGRDIEKRAHLISICNQYELPTTVLKNYLCEILKTYPVSTIPAPIREKTPPEIARKHFNNFKASLGEVNHG